MLALSVSSYKYTIKIWINLPWPYEKCPNKKSLNVETPLYIRQPLTQSNLTTLSIAMFSMPYACGGQSGPLLAVFFKLRTFRTFLIRTLLMALLP